MCLGQITLTGGGWPVRVPRVGERTDTRVGERTDTRVGERTDTRGVGDTGGRGVWLEGQEVQERDETKLKLVEEECLVVQDDQ